MSKRYYLAARLGDGNADIDESEWTQTTGAYRPAVQDHGVQFSAVQADDLPWSLALVEAPDHTALVADPFLYALPDVPLDVRVDAIDPARVSGLTAALMARGAPSSIVTGATSFRDVVRGIGQYLVPGFIDGGLQVAG